MRRGRYNAPRYYDCIARNERQVQAKSVRGMAGAMVQPSVKGTLKDLRVTHSKSRAESIQKPTEKPTTPLYLSYYPGGKRPNADASNHLPPLRQSRGF